MCRPVRRSSCRRRSTRCCRSLYSWMTAWRRRRLPLRRLRGVPRRRKGPQRMRRPGLWVSAAAWTWRARTRPIRTTASTTPARRLVAQALPGHRRRRLRGAHRRLRHRLRPLPGPPLRRLGLPQRQKEAQTVRKTGLRLRRGLPRRRPRARDRPPGARPGRPTARRRRHRLPLRRRGLPRRRAHRQTMRRGAPPLRRGLQRPRREARPTQREALFFLRAGPWATPGPGRERTPTTPNTGLSRPRRRRGAASPPSTGEAAL